MPNTNAPFGAVPFQGADGAAPTYGMVSRLIAWNNTTAIFRGDLVRQLTTGFVAQWTNGTAVSQAVGIFWGCKYYSLSQQATTFSRYWPGSDVATNAVVTAFIIPINTGVPAQFVIQSNATGATFADIGGNFDVVVGTGSTTTGVSGMTLDVATGAAATATLPFRLVGLLSSVIPGAVLNGTDTGAFNRVIVQANIYQETGLT
jgi:hypothetical protein